MLRVSSAQSFNAARAAYLLKIAVCTIPRCGIVTIVFLFFGFFLMVDGYFLYQEFWTAQRAPVEVRSTVVTESISLDGILGIEGVINASPVVFMDAELVGKDHSLSCEIQAVQGTYLTTSQLEGHIYPDFSNMPVLVVNLEAGFGCGEKVQLCVAERELTAVVSGRCIDDTGEPAVYMSYETALALYPQFDSDELLLTLEGRRGYEQSLNELQKNGLFLDEECVPEDRDTMVLLGSCFLLAGTFLICTISLLRERHLREQLLHKDEMVFLFCSGIVPVGWVYRIRILTVALACVIVASVLLVYICAP